MKFSEKLKRIRKENSLTQEELARLLYVTRTAISKWENDKGYPSIDSLRLISKTFNVSIDELMSEEDIENQKLIKLKRAKIFYFIAIGCFFIAVIFTLLVYFLEIKYFAIGSVVGVLLYIFFSYFSLAKYKRIEREHNKVKFVLSKIIAYFIVLVVIIMFIVQMFS